MTIILHLTFSFFVALFHETVYAVPLCPHAWTQSVIPGKCFRILKRKATAPDASDVCRDLGGYLASIESAAEQDFVLKYILNETDDWLRIGGRKNVATKTWFWEDGSPMKYSGWHSGEAKLEDDSRIFMFLYSNKNDEGRNIYGTWHASQDRTNKYDMLCQLRLPMAGLGFPQSPSPAVAPVPWTLDAAK